MRLPGGAISISRTLTEVCNAEAERVDMFKLLIGFMAGCSRLSTGTCDSIEFFLSPAHLVLLAVLLFFFFISDCAIFRNINMRRSLVCNDVRIGLISSLLPVILLLTVSFTNAAPLSAIAMIEGRTYDQAHDTGYIDWSGSAQYVYVTHRDGSYLPPQEGGAYCGSSCTEWVTRLGQWWYGEWLL